MQFEENLKQKIVPGVSLWTVTSLTHPGRSNCHLSLDCVPFGWLLLRLTPLWCEYCWKYTSYSHFVWLPILGKPWCKPTFWKPILGNKLACIFKELQKISHAHCYHSTFRCTCFVLHILYIHIYAWYYQRLSTWSSECLPCLFTWWRHQMETFSALLAICAGNSSVAGDFPTRRPWRGALMFSLICAWINDGVNNGEAGDLRRRRAHFDVTAIIYRYFTISCCILKLAPLNHRSKSITTYHHYSQTGQNMNTLNK